MMFNQKKPDQDVYTMRLCAAAKINLALHITGRREDGYHLLDTLVTFAEYGDVIEAKPANDLALGIIGPFASSLNTGSGNLVIKAAQLLKQKATDNGINVPGAAITLEKLLPIASGIGGGSADAAATLHILCKLWKIDISKADLLQIALELGADVPMCLHSTHLRARGVGELIDHVRLPDMSLVLINPGVGIVTSDVFSNLDHNKSEHQPLPDLPRSLSLQNLVHWLEKTSNDLEKPIIAAAPVVMDVIDVLQGYSDCLFARMSGSGATCFGIFASIEQAKSAANDIGQTNPDWWCVATKTVGY